MNSNVSIATKFSILQRAIKTLVQEKTETVPPFVTSTQEDVFTQALILSNLCFQLNLSSVQLKSINNTFFQNEALILPLGEAWMGTVKAAKVEIQILPSAPSILIVRRSVDSKIELRVRLTQQTAVHEGYLFQILKPIGAKQVPFEVIKDTGAFKVVSYGVFDAQGENTYGVNFPTGIFNIQQIIEAICYLG